MGTHLAKNTAFMTFASVGQKIIAFVYFLCLARVMMPETTGIFFLATSFITMFSVLSDLGLTSIVIREIAKDPKNREQYVRRAIGLKLILISFAVIIVSLATVIFQYSDEISRLIFITMIVMILDALALLCFGVLRGSQLLTYEAMSIVIGQCVTFLIGGLSLFLNPDVTWLVIALICGSFTNLLVASFFVVRTYGRKILKPIFDGKAMKQAIHVMIPFALAGIFTKIYSNVDVLFISKFMTTAAVGIYSVAYKFTYAFQFLPLALSAALYPSLSSTIEHNLQATTKTFSRSVWYIFLMVTPIVFGMWIMAPFLVSLTGSGYASSAVLLRALIFVLFPSFLEIPFGALLNAANRQKTRMKILGICMLLNVTLDFFLITRFGLFGVVIASLVSYSLMIILECIAVVKFLPSFLNAIFLKSVVGILLSGFVMFVFSYALLSKMSLIFLLPCAFLVYAFSLFVTKSFTKNDVESLRTLFHKTSVV